MSIQQKNWLKGNNVIVQNVFGESNPDVSFNPKISSTDLPQFYFINYAHNKRSNIIKKIKSEKRRFLTNSITYEDEYEIKPVEQRTNEQNKIDAILQNTIGINTVDLTLLWRLKNSANPELQFFFLDKLDGTYEVLFIDLYHLVLPAPDADHDETTANPIKKYNDNKSARYNLSELFNEI